MEAEYLQGATKELNDDHWTDHFNVHPRLNRTDVQVKTKKIEDPTEEERTKCNSRNHIFAPHILCTEKDEQDVNIQMGNLYNKERKSLKAAANLPEARAMRYVPYNATHKITQTSKSIVKLQKNRLIHKWRQEQHHSIPFWGFDNIYKVLIAPNGFECTLYQVVISIKSGVDYITPLFLVIDVSPEGEVIITCDISMKTEAKGILSHLGIYVAFIFGSVVWQAFTVSYKDSMEPYQYYSNRGCAVEIDNSIITSDDSFDRESSKCGLSNEIIYIPEVVELDPAQQITLHICPDIVGLLSDENRDSGTIRSDCSDVTIATSKSAPFQVVYYLLPPPPTPLLNPAPSTVITNTSTSKEDAIDSSETPTPTPSTEVALNIRSEESNVD